MSGRRIVFLDRDGCLIEEPADEQVDALAKIRLMPDVIAALLIIKAAGYEFVMVTNQDGLGTENFPRARFDEAQAFILEILASQGIEFAEIFVCPHFATDGCQCRKPSPGILGDFLKRNEIDRARCFVVGDRDTDLELARNLGVEGLRVRLRGTPAESWRMIGARIAASGRRAVVHRKTKETDVAVEVDLAKEGPTSVDTGLGFFDHMLEQVAKHGGFALQLRAAGDLNVDEHHTVEDCALAFGSAVREALGDKRGIGRFDW